MAQCTAKAKSTGQRCRRRAVTGYTVCQVHGAGSPYKGRPGGGPLKHGRFSKFLPTRMLDNYEEYLQDSEIIAIRETMSLAYARLADLLGRVDKGESGLLWKKARECFKSLKKSMSDKDIDGTRAAMSELEKLITHGISDYAIWREVYEVSELIRRQSETEQKRLEKAQQMISTERVLVLISAVAGIIEEEIRDNSTRAIIAQRIYKLMERNG